MKIILIGFASSGKSTVGRILADKLQTNFYDTDALIEKETHLTVAQIFSQFGEEHFRALENQTMERLRNVDNAVIALGGGSVLCAAFSALTENATVVWLQVSADKAIERLAGDFTRPLFSGLTFAAFHDLITKRNLLYSAAHNLAVDTDSKTPDQVAQEILRCIQ